MHQMARSKKKNPYASRGLDKFSSVVSALQAKKKKIMSGAGSNGIASVRFMCSDSCDWTPVVVRRREEEEEGKRSGEGGDLPPPSQQKREKMEKKEIRWWRWRPSYYMMGVVLLILLCFVVSGRGFAICCVSVCWYLLPVLRGEESGERRRGRWR
ncbi:uncharacterized protein LOC110027213 [Phalaenopsis equestris]|uniref:uncharacterized protein LOC110027213 n=1 Tax=Phalaenopsis equestris TaxID=78828 RepID=UPI0009E4F3B2|nr:uncharacterized protein LOC110027213 [Phalaenopsis equestris]